MSWSPPPGVDERWFWTQVAHGLHARIPDCCVLAWCLAGPEGQKWLRRCAEVPGLQARSREVEYVPCPACARRIVAREIAPAAIHGCLQEPGPLCAWMVQQDLTDYELFAYDARLGTEVDVTAVYGRLMDERGRVS